MGGGGSEGSWVAWVKLWRRCRQWCGFIKVGVSQKQYQYPLRSVDFHYIVSVPYMYSFLLSFFSIPMIILYSNWRGPKII